MQSPPPPPVRQSSSWLASDDKKPTRQVDGRVGPDFQATLPTFGDGASGGSGRARRLDADEVGYEHAVGLAAMLTAVAYDEGEARNLAGWRSDYADEMPMVHENAGPLHPGMSGTLIRTGAATGSGLSR